VIDDPIQSRVRVRYCLYAQLIRVWVSACFFLLTAVDGHLCLTYTSSQSCTPSISCACSSHHECGCKLPHIPGTFARKQSVSGAGSVTAWRSPDTCWMWERTGSSYVEAKVNRITPKTLANTNLDCSGHRALLYFSLAAVVRTYCYVLLRRSVLCQYLYAFQIRCVDDYDPNKHVCINLFGNASEY
jgi:hypothetical protein